MKKKMNMKILQCTCRQYLRIRRWENVLHNIMVSSIQDNFELKLVSSKEQHTYVANDLKNSCVSIINFCSPFKLILSSIVYCVYADRTQGLAKNNNFHVIFWYGRHTLHAIRLSVM